MSIQPGFQPCWAGAQMTAVSLTHHRGLNGSNGKPAIFLLSATGCVHTFVSQRRRRPAAVKMSCAPEGTESAGAVDLQHQQQAPPSRNRAKRFWIPHNPLKRSSQQPINLPHEWMAENFSDPSLPLHIDIGSDRGHFCMKMAALWPDCNFLGMEVRSYPVGEAQKALQASPGLRNCAFLHANANAHLEELRSGILKNAEVCTISLNFPDPWTKKKHHKRRVMQPGFAPLLAETLAPGGRLIVQTDVLELAEDMRAVARTCPLLADEVEDIAEWRSEWTPFPVMTEWEEQLAGVKEREVYRFSMLRADQAIQLD